VTNRSQWLELLEPLKDPEEIRRRATLRPPKLKDLRLLSSQAAAAVVDATLAQQFVVTDSVLRVLQVLVERATVHCQSAYANEGAYIERVFAPPAELPRTRPILITGPAGHGKTEIAKALIRVLPGVKQIYVGGAIGCAVPASFCAYVAHDARKTMRAAMSDWYPPDVRAKSGKSRMSDVEVLRSVAKEFYKHGVMSAIADEFQFMTQSSDANARLAYTLLAWLTLGVPPIFILNYSACHKLLRRPEEEIDRLMSHILQLTPGGPDSQDWIAHLETTDGALAPILKFRLVDEREEAWRLTAASKRKLRWLLVSTYERVRGEGRQKIEVKDLRATYSSVELSGLSRDVEATHEQLRRGVQIKGRSDLWSPFGGNDWNVPLQSLQEPPSDPPGLAGSIVEDSLSSSERKTLEKLKAGASEASAERSTKHRNSKAAKSGSALLENQRAHRARSKY